jgi:oligo-1,6-glucosidase
VNPNANTINAAAQVDDPDSVFSFYRKVIALRHSDPVIAYGDFSMLLPDDEHVYAFTRSLPDAELLVLANFSGTGRTAGLDDGWLSGGGLDGRGTAELVLGNYPPDAGERQPLELRPWEVKVFRRDR